MRLGTVGMENVTDLHIFRYFIPYDKNQNSVLLVIIHFYFVINTQKPSVAYGNKHAFLKHLLGLPHPGWVCLEGSAHSGCALLGSWGWLGLDDLDWTWLMRNSVSYISHLPEASLLVELVDTQENEPQAQLSSFCSCHFCQHHELFMDFGQAMAEPQIKSHSRSPWPWWEHTT